MVRTSYCREKVVIVRYQQGVDKGYFPRVAKIHRSICERLSDPILMCNAIRDKVASLGVPAVTPMWGSHVLLPLYPYI